MEIIKKLSYGVEESTPTAELYIRTVTLINNKKPANNKKIMDALSDIFNICQYNYDDALKSDYFSWCLVRDDDVPDYSHIDLSIYTRALDYNDRMLALINEIVKTGVDCELWVIYDNINNLIKDIETQENWKKYVAVRSN